MMRASPYQVRSVIRKLRPRPHHLLGQEPHLVLTLQFARIAHDMCRPKHRTRDRKNQAHVQMRPDAGVYRGKNNELCELYTLRGTRPDSDGDEGRMYSVRVPIFFVETMMLSLYHSGITSASVLLSNRSG